jgi:hypothetical protein
MVLIAFLAGLAAGGAGGWYLYRRYSKQLEAQFAAQLAAAKAQLANVQAKAAAVADVVKS